MDFLFTKYDEAFYTINFIPQIIVGSYNLTVFVGLFFLFGLFCLFTFRHKISNFSGSILVLILICFLPFYINSVLNRFYDVKVAYEHRELNEVQKRIVRLCDIGFVHGRDEACKLSNFVKVIKKYIDDESATIFAGGYMGEALSYYLYPEVVSLDNLNKTDYVILYNSSKYFWRDDLLYKNASNEILEIGKYELITRFNAGLILKKI